MKIMIYIMLAFAFAIAGCVQPPNEEGRLSCSSDDDCVNEFACCHRGNGPCINKNYVEETDCAGIACTEECRPCNVCKCKNNICQGETHGADEGYCC